MNVRGSRLLATYLLDPATQDAIDAFGEGVFERAR
jgi:hypothetical protein